MKQKLRHVAISVSLNMNLITKIDEIAFARGLDRSRVIVYLLEAGLELEAEKETIRLAREVAIAVDLKDIEKSE